VIILFETLLFVLALNAGLAHVKRMHGMRRLRKHDLLTGLVRDSAIYFLVYVLPKTCLHEFFSLCNVNHDNHRVLAAYIGNALEWLALPVSLLLVSTLVSAARHYLQREHGVSSRTGFLWPRLVWWDVA
jgi:hypothetical protein